MLRICTELISLPGLPDVIVIIIAVLWSIQHCFKYTSPVLIVCLLETQTLCCY